MSVQTDSSELELNCHIEDKIDVVSLYNLCRSRDEEGWLTLYNECLQRADFKTKLDAEDVAQEACLKVLDKIETIRDPKAFLGFARRVVDNIIVDRFRKDRWKTELDGSDESLPLTETKEHAEKYGSSYNPEAQAEARRQLRMICAKVVNLPDYCQRLVDVYIRYHLGLVRDYKEMAAILKITIGTLSGQINRCIAMLGGLVGVNA